MKPKTPTMTLPVSEKMSVADIDKFCKTASRLALSQVVDDVQVDETLITEDSERRRNFTVTIRLFPASQYQDEYNTTPGRVLTSLGLPFGLILKKEIQVELKKLNSDIKSQFANVGKGRKAPQNEVSGGAEDSDDDDAEDDASGEKEAARTKAATRDDVSEVGEGDAEEEKRIRQTRQQSYESDSEDEEVESVAAEEDEDEDAADSDADEIHDDGLTNPNIATSARVRSVDKYLSDTCSVVVPGSLSFKYKGESQCSFNLSVRSIFSLCTDPANAFPL